MSLAISFNYHFSIRFASGACLGGALLRRINGMIVPFMVMSTHITHIARNPKPEKYEDKKYKHDSNATHL